MRMVTDSACGWLRHPNRSKSDFCLFFLAIFIPPLPVLIIRGCSGALCLNILLDFLGWIPGVIRMSGNLVPYFLIYLPAFGRHANALMQMLFTSYLKTATGNHVVIDMKHARERKSTGWDI